MAMLMQCCSTHACKADGLPLMLLTGKALVECAQVVAQRRGVPSASVGCARCKLGWEHFSTTPSIEGPHQCSLRLP